MKLPFKLVHPETKKHLAFSATASAFLVFLTAFKWSIIDWITPFLYIPLQGAAWLFLLATGTSSVACLFRYGIAGYRAFIPLAITVLGVLLVVFFPFSKLWLKIDYAWYTADRKIIVEKILKGELKSNASYSNGLFALDGSYPKVSQGGNDIVVEEHDGATYIFFFTFRGILDSYAGFLYVSRKGNPRAFMDISEENRSEISIVEDDWYYVSHH